MTFYSPTTGQVFLPTTSPGVFFTTASTKTLYQPPPISASSSPLHLSCLGKYGQCYSRTTSVVLGILLIGCGCTSLAGATMSFMFYAQLSFVATGFWCGAMFVTAGGIAIAAGHHRTDSLIVATTVTSGLSVAFGITQLIVTAFGLAKDVAHWECPIWKCTDEPHNDCQCYTWEHGPVVAGSMMVAASTIVIILGFVLFVFCLKTTCCKSTQQALPLAAQYVPIFPQQLHTEAITNQKMIPLPMQMQCTPTQVSMQPAAKSPDDENNFSRNLLHDSL